MKIVDNKKQLELSIQFPNINLLFEDGIKPSSLGYTDYCLTIIDHIASSVEEYELYFVLSKKQKKAIGFKRTGFYKNLIVKIFKIDDDEIFSEFETDKEIEEEFLGLDDKNRSFGFYCLPDYNLLFRGEFDYSDTFYFRGNDEIEVIRKLALDHGLFLFKNPDVEVSI
jgi:hypothetical protein